MEKEILQQKLNKFDELIKITKQARDDAMIAKTTSETKLSTSVENLKKLGVSPENAEKELEKINDEIEVLLKDIEDNIPLDLLKELKRI